MIQMKIQKAVFIKTWPVILSYWITKYPDHESQNSLKLRCSDEPFWTKLHETTVVVCPKKWDNSDLGAPKQWVPFGSPQIPSQTDHQVKSVGGREGGLSVTVVATRAAARPGDNKQWGNWKHSQEQMVHSRLVPVPSQGAYGYSAAGSICSHLQPAAVLTWGLAGQQERHSTVAGLRPCHHLGSCYCSSAPSLPSLPPSSGAPGPSGTEISLNLIICIRCITTQK